MDGERSWLGTAITGKVWTLNAGRDAFDDKLVLAALAVMFQDGEIYTLVYAISEPELYDPFVVQCNVVFFSGENPLQRADVILKKTGIVAQEWKWKETRFQYSIIIDANELLFKSASEVSGAPDENTIRLYQRRDAMQIRAAAQIIDALAD